MNVSETNRVKLTNKREIPQEVVFKATSKNQDGKILNRYHFEFPPQWTKQLDKDAVIGIRSIFLTKKNRFIKFKFNINLSRLDSEEYQTDFARSGTFGCFLDQNESIEKLCGTWSSHWLEYSKITEGEELGIDLEKYDIVLNYIYTVNQCLFMLGLPYKDNDTIVKNGVEYNVKIYLEAISDDFKSIFGSDILTASARILIPCWSRKSCMVTSSIAEEADGNYLGHTRDYAYDPIKYYRITSKHKRFWIDLWDSRENNIPVELPYDDQLWIEAIIMFDANSIL